MNEDRNNNSKARFKLFEMLVGVFVPVILALVGIPALVSPIRTDRESASIFRAHNLDIAAFAYSQDHNSVYPFGGSSTEIFQMLYDQKYLLQREDVFLAAKGKRLASAGNAAIKLKSENVSWDFVTQYNSGLKDSDPSDLPIVFSDADTAPTWRSGVNNATINSSNPWGTDGVTVATLSQQTVFIRPDSVPGEVQLTSRSFKTSMVITYVTRKP